MSKIDTRENRRRALEVLIEGNGRRRAKEMLAAELDIPVGSAELQSLVAYLDTGINALLSTVRYRPKRITRSIPPGRAD